MWRRVYGSIMSILELNENVANSSRRLVPINVAARPNDPKWDAEVYHGRERVNL